MITCGRCTKEVHEVVKHDSVATVRACYAASDSYFAAEMMAQADADAELDRRAERWYEERGGSDDGFDEWERSRGVIDFSTAMALAEGR